VNGRALVERRYTWDRAAGALAHLYGEVLEETTRNRTRKAG
jgi:hypothetical protein